MLPCPINSTYLDNTSQHAPSTPHIWTTHHNTATLHAATLLSLAPASAMLPQRQTTNCHNCAGITYNRNGIANVTNCATMFTYRNCSDVSELNSPESSDVNLLLNRYLQQSVKPKPKSQHQAKQCMITIVED